MEVAAVRPERLACLRPPRSHHRAHRARDDHGLAHRSAAELLLLLLLLLLRLLLLLLLRLRLLVLVLLRLLLLRLLVLRLRLLPAGDESLALSR